MPTRGLIAALVMTFGLGSAAAGQGVLYDCTISDGGKAGTWISPRLVLIVTDEGTGQVVDGVTLTFADGARPARVRTRGELLRFDWNIAGAYDSAQQRIPTFTYRANFNPATGEVSLRAKPANFPQSFSGSGTCTTRSNMTARQLNRLLRGG